MSAHDTDPPPLAEPTTPTLPAPARDALVIPPGSAREIVASAVQRLADALVELENVTMQVAARFDATAKGDRSMSPAEFRRKSWEWFRHPRAAMAA